MRVNVNLASQKFEDVRELYVRMGTASAAAAVITIILALLAWSNYTNSVESNRRSKELRQKIATLEQERAAAEAVENRPENRGVTLEKNFWNREILRKSFSWTQLFNDLQHIMPGRAYVAKVQPELTPDGRLKLALEIVSEKHDNALELVRKMEGSERFRSPQITVENSQKDARTGAATYRFEITTYYLPAGPAPLTTKEGL